jgi:Domain of unknown function (DUF4388)
LLNGSLDDFTLPDIFRLLSASKKTGRLDVERAAGSGSVFFHEGEVYFASSSLSTEPLGQKLVRVGAISEAQLRRALDERASSGKRVGEILVGWGAITNAQLRAAVSRQIEDSAFDLLRWEAGRFTWHPGVEIDSEVHIRSTVTNLIMEASRRLDEFDTIKRRIPSPHAVLGMVESPSEDADHMISIVPHEWRVLMLVDGQRSAADIAAIKGLTEFQAMRVLYGLLSAGLIEVVENGSSSNGARLGLAPPIRDDRAGENGDGPVSEGGIGFQPESSDDDGYISFRPEADDDRPTSI